MMDGPRLGAALTHGRLVKPRSSAQRATVSVVVPCYNYGHYLTECVQSIVTQDGVDLEVIIVDDASTDGSAEVATDLARDPRVRLIKHPGNRGHIQTFNDGLQAATGEYLLLISADDVLAPDALKRAADVFAALPEVGLVYGRATPFTDQVPSPVPASTAWITWSGLQWQRLRCRAGINCIYSPEALVRADVWRQVRPYDPDIPHASDLAMWLSMAGVSDVAYIAGSPQAYYRQHTSNLHSSEFKIGQLEGMMYDLEERHRAFEAGIYTSPAHDREELRALASRALATEAIELASRAVAWRLEDWPLEQFISFAEKLDPSVRTLRRARSLKVQDPVVNVKLSTRVTAKVTDRVVKLGYRADRWRAHHWGV